MGGFIRWFLITAAAMWGASKIMPPGPDLGGARSLGYESGQRLMDLFDRVKGWAQGRARSSR